MVGSVGTSFDKRGNPTMRKRVRYSGRVQGVGFRVTVYGIAARFPVSGWVRNEPDGDVLLEVQGADADVAAVLAEVRSVMARNILAADEIAVQPATGESEFTIQR